MNDQAVIDRADVQKRVEATRAAAERINGHEGEHACCCDRCAYLAHFIVLHALEGEARSLRLILDIVALEVPSNQSVAVLLVLMNRVAENAERRAAIAEEIALEHWRQLGETAPVC